MIPEAWLETSAGVLLALVIYQLAVKGFDAIVAVVKAQRGKPISIKFPPDGGTKEIQAQLVQLLVLINSTLEAVQEPLRSIARDMAEVRVKVDTHTATLAEISRDTAQLRAKQNGGA